MELKPNQGGLALNNTTLLVAGGISLLTGFGISYLIQNHNKKAIEDGNQEKKSVPKKKKIIRKPLENKRDYARFQEVPDYKLSIEQRYSNQNDLLDELHFLEEPTCEIQKIPHLAAILELKDFPKIISPLLVNPNVENNEIILPEESFVCQNSYVLSTAIFGPKNPITEAKKYLRAGPRKHVFFQPEEVRACVVTAGGLCPGLNVVIREIVNCLHYNYGVKVIYGIRYAYRGFCNYDWEELTPEKVVNIHHLGGSVLGSSRGGFDIENILAALEEKRINQIYIIGGDGTHRSINALFTEISKRKLRITIVGVPKTIDNDIPIIDKSFGFESAVEEATRAIQSADVEANAAEYGVGLVKLMGRHAGFIAMNAALANRDVNICLVPEFQFEIGGPRGLLEFIARRLKFKRKCVIVVAEGVASAILDVDLGDKGKDASGNIKFADVGVFLRDKIIDHCKAKGIDVTLKYIDPTYMIRSIPANALDKQICSQLAQNAVHGAMAGWTGFTVGNVHDRACYIPLSEINAKRQIEQNDRAWQRLLASTGQPSFLNDENYNAEDTA